MNIGFCPNGEWDFAEIINKMSRESIVKIFRKLFLGLLGLFISTGIGFCANENAQAVLTFTLPEYTHIKPITSPVLTANITDRTGNLYAPLHTTFRVITNSAETKTLYLQANINTQGGYESAMFEQGGRVYVAFGSLRKIPTSQSLANCKIGSMPKDSPGVVAYPVENIYGADHKFIRGKNKYEVYVNNGTTDITVNIGSNVLQNSFAANDPRGFYQAILSLTEADI